MYLNTAQPCPTIGQENYNLTYDLTQGFPTGVHLDPRGSTGLLECPSLVTLIAYC